MMLTSPWRLSLLFLVSGVATGYLLSRQGVRGFLGQRSVRLLVPLAFGMAVIVPPQSYLEVVEKIAYPGSYADFWRLYLSAYHGFCRGTDCLRIPTWNHLWFVAYLWVYTLILYVVVRAIPGVVPWSRRLLERHFAGLGVLLWPIAFLAVIRVALVEPFPATHALVDDWYNHALYLPVFLAGFALAGTQAPWKAIERVRWPTLGLAILGWAFLCAYFGIYNDDAMPPPDVLKLIQRIIYGAQQWLAIVAILGFARRHLARDSEARRYLTTAIFPVYILHQTVIVVLAHALKPAHLNPGVEGMLLVLATAAVCFLCYEGIRRVTLLRPLFGLGHARETTRPLVATGALAPQDVN
jgi:hypothetical protein